MKKLPAWQPCLALGAVDVGVLHVALLLLVHNELVGKVGDEGALHALELAPEVLQGGMLV